MSFFVLDASVWVRAWFLRMNFTRWSKPWMAEQRTTEGAVCLSCVIAGRGCRGGQPAYWQCGAGTQAVKELETLPGLRLVEMNNALLLEAAILAADLGLRGADSVYVATAKRLGVPLVTFDVDQRERGKKQVSIHDI